MQTCLRSKSSGACDTFSSTSWRQEDDLTTILFLMTFLSASLFFCVSHLRRGNYSSRCCRRKRRTEDSACASVGITDDYEQCFERAEILEGEDDASSPLRARVVACTWYWWRLGCRVFLSPLTNTNVFKFVFRPFFLSYRSEPLDDRVVCFHQSSPQNLMYNSHLNFNNYWWQSTCSFNDIYYPDVKKNWIKFSFSLAEKNYKNYHHNVNKNSPLFFSKAFEKSFFFVVSPYSFAFPFNLNLGLRKKLCNDLGDDLEDDEKKKALPLLSQKSTEEDCKFTSLSNDDDDSTVSSFFIEDLEDDDDDFFEPQSKATPFFLCRDDWYWVGLSSPSSHPDTDEPETVRGPIASSSSSRQKAFVSPNRIEWVITKLTGVRKSWRNAD